MHVRRVAFFLATLAWGAAACSAFSLNDVLPVTGSGSDGGGQPDAPLRDGTASDAPTTPPDAGNLDAEGGAPLCDAGGDPCACLTPPTLVSAGNGAILSLRLESAYAYWLATTGGNPNLYRAPIDGDGAPPDELAATLGVGSASDFAVDPDYVYLVIGNNQPVLTRFPIDGGSKQSLTLVLPELPADLSVTSSAFYWTDQSAEICAAALDGAIAPGDSGCGGTPVSPAQLDGGFSTNHLLVGDAGFWLSVQKTAELRRVPITGGPGSSVTPLNGFVSTALVGTDTDVYWAEPRPDAAVVLHETAAGDASVVVATESAIAALAVDEVNVYVIVGTSANKPIVEVPLSGAPPRILGCDANVPNALALDATYVYWSNSVGEVKRIAK